MFSPKNKAAEVHIRFSSSGVLYQDDGPPEYLTLGLTLRKSRGMWEIESTPKGAQKLSHTLGPRVEAVI